MSRAFAVAFGVVVALAAVTGSLVFLSTRDAPARRPSPPVPPPPGPEALAVLAAEGPDRAVVIRPRSPAGAVDGYGDRSLADALGLPAGEWAFVEVWVLNRAEGDLSTLVTPPAVTDARGATIALRGLRELVPAGSSPRARMLVASLAPDPARLLRKGTLRRTVYAMPAGTPFGDLLSAEADGLRLARRETTDQALETFLERPRRDMMAALSEAAPAGAPESGPASTEDSR